MTRFNAVADRVPPNTAFGLTNYDNLQAIVNYLSIPGANIAAVDASISANTVSISAGFHKATFATGNVDSINDALGAVAGQKTRLKFSSPQTIRNNGGGTGNIRTQTGADLRVGANQTVTLEYDGANWWPTSVGVPFRVNGLYDYVSSTTEVSLISGATASGTTGWKIAANTLGPNGLVWARLEGTYLNNTGSSQTLTPKVKFGGTTFYGHAASIGTGSSRSPFTMDFFLGNLAATGSNYIAGLMERAGGSSAGSVAGLVAGTTPDFFGASGAQSIDTTADQYLDITMTHGANSASLSLQRMFAIAEVL